MSPIRLAVIGAGHLGRIHARLAANLEGMRLVAIADVDSEACKEVAAANGALACADVNELIGQIDAAIVAVPTRWHHKVAGDLLRHGVHVLVEKPITTTLAEADELIDLARRNGRVLQVGHVERFNPVWRPVSSHLTPPRYLEVVRCGPYTFRSTDVSVVHDLMIHDIDLALWLTGSAVNRVDAVGGMVIGPHDDLAQARIEFANGAVANLSASRVSYESQRRMRLFSNQGFVSVDMAARTATLARPGEQFANARSTALPSNEQARLKDRFFEEVIALKQWPAANGNAIADELADFRDSILQQRSPQVNGQAGRAALEVCEQVCRSISAWRQSSDTPACAPIRRAA
jgi:predicted dehydrogenase